MNISDYMKSDSPTGAQLSAGDCWIYFSNGVWVLIEKKYHRNPRILGRFDSEDSAIDAMRRALGEIK